MGPLGLVTFSLRGPVDTCLGGEGKGWETELFQGSLEDGFHSYTVGSELVLGDWFVLLSFCIAVIV